MLFLLLLVIITAANVCPCNGNLVYIVGDFAHDEAVDVCMARGMFLASVDNLNRQQVADCFEQCRLEEYSRMWVAQVDGLAGNPCVYITNGEGIGAVFSLGSSVCADLTAGVLCAITKDYRSISYTDSRVDSNNTLKSHDSGELCFGDDGLVIVNTPVPHHQAEHTCSQYGFTLADYTSGTRRAIINTLNRCSPNDPTGWFKSINGIVNDQHCTIGQVLEPSVLAMSISITLKWCEGLFVAVCRDQKRVGQ